MYTLDPQVDESFSKNNFQQKSNNEFLLGPLKVKEKEKEEKIFNAYRKIIVYQIQTNVTFKCQRVQSEILK